MILVTVVDEWLDWMTVSENESTPLINGWKSDTCRMHQYEIAFNSSDFMGIYHKTAIHYFK